MKYLGKKSLSSWLSGICHVSWYIVLIVAILAVVTGLVLLLCQPIRDLLVSEITKPENFCSRDAKDQKDWEAFKNWPLIAKMVLVPYCAAVIILLLQILKKAEQLFTNFKNDIVFNKSNVSLLSTISKLNIAFSIITFSFSTLLVSVLLFMLCDIIKNGATLQEEHDLTV